MKVWPRNSSCDDLGGDYRQGADAPRADSDGIRKYLPKSYRTAFNFTLPRTEFAKTDDSYHCAITEVSRARPDLQAIQGR